MAFGTTNAAVLTGTIVTVGRWSEGDTLTIRIIVGVTFLAIFLAVLEEGNPKLASQFAVLVLIAAALRYTVPIVNKSGITNTSMKS